MLHQSEMLPCVMLFFTRNMHVCANDDSSACSV